MNKYRVTFKYGLSFDVARVLETYEKMVFYKKHDYRFDLPKFTNKEDSFLKINYDSPKGTYELTNILEPRYNGYSRDYQKTLPNIRKAWKKVEKQGYYQRVEDITGLKVPNKMLCVITKWGIGGNALPPNKLVVRINNEQAWDKTKEGHKGRTSYKESVAFGVVDLLLRNLYKESEISWNKYIRIIDLINAETDLLFKTFMKRGEDSIDAEFNSCIGDIEQLFK